MPIPARLGRAGPPTVVLAVAPIALLTAAAGLAWMAGGLLLLVWGWWSLSRRRSQEAEPLRRPRDSRVLRAGVGSLLGALATILGITAIGEGSALSAAIGTFVPPALSDFVSREVSGFTRLFAAPFVSSVALGFERIGAFLWLGIEVLARSVVFGAGFEAQFVVINQVAVAAAILTGALVGWVSYSSKWKIAGVTTYLGADLMALGFLALTIAVVEASANPIAQALGLGLVATLLFGFLLFLCYQFYALEHIAGLDAAKEPETLGPAPKDWPAWPFVLVQVASFNEDPEVVQECLRSLRRLDYPADRFVVQLCDDSTDAETVTQLAAICQSEHVDFQHRANRRGFKGGALNDGLHAVKERVDLVAIVDSDYFVQPAFLRRTVPGFRDPKIAFVQTPQAYRNIEETGLSRWYELADAYFYRVVQPVRARFQSLIFCGTMGVLRRAALEDAGGWSENCVTEDAELTMRMLARGWRGRYVPENLGAGLAPDLMSAVRSQQRRWAFGGIQMLSINRKLLYTRRLTVRQRFDFFTTGLFWFDGLFLVGITALIASFVVASWFSIWLPFAEFSTPAIVAAVPVVMMLDGMAKMRAALGRTRPVGFRDVLGVLSFWYALKINDLRAAVQAWAGRSIPFARTPKQSKADDSRWVSVRASVRGAITETSVAVCLIGIVVASLVIWPRMPASPSGAAYVIFLAWLLYYAYAFASAAWFDYESRRSLVRSVARRAGPPTGAVLPD